MKGKKKKSHHLPDYFEIQIPFCGVFFFFLMFFWQFTRYAFIEIFLIKPVFFSSPAELGNSQQFPAFTAYTKRQTLKLNSFSLAINLLLSIEQHHCRYDARSENVSPYKVCYCSALMILANKIIFVSFIKISIIEWMLASSINKELKHFPN